MKLIRIEGVNLSSCIYDTEDLSTRRGGGLMMLNVINKISEQTKDLMTPISTGASAGLFQLIGNAKIDGVKDKINTVLSDEPFCYGTFVINEVNESDFNSAEVQAIALNRWQQMQTLSFSNKGLEASNNGICKIDEIRPAHSEGYSSESKKTYLSASIASRRAYGKEQKQRFYQSIISKDETEDDSKKKSISFTNSFEEIATNPLVNIKPSNLIGKIAVFYADGNSFGSIASGCKSADELTKWDTYIKGERAKLLSEIINHAKERLHWLSKREEDKCTIRLETLLWGGDEVMFVVPAWCGLEFAQLFFQQTNTMRYPQNNNSKLTHACGLVFCHHQAPISRISSLAKDLAEKGKEHNRLSNSLNWIALESFDHTGSGLDNYLDRRFNQQLTWNNISLSPEFLTTLISKIPTLKKTLPRSAIIKLIQYLVTQNNVILSDSNKTKDDKTNDAEANDAEAKEHPLFLRAFEQITEIEQNKTELTCLYKNITPDNQQTTPVEMKNNLAFWLIIIELWDYCCSIEY